MHQPSKLSIAGSSPAVPVGDLFSKPFPNSSVVELKTVNFAVPRSNRGWGVCLFINSNEHMI